MELRNTGAPQGPDRGHEAAVSSPKGMEKVSENLAEARSSVGEAVRDSEEALRRSAVLTRAAHDDRIDLSEVAQLFTADDAEAVAARAALIDELRGAYQNGTLASPERIEKAAQRLLSPN